MARIEATAHLPRRRGRGLEAPATAKARADLDIAIIRTVGALAGAILPGQYAMRRDMAGIHRDVAGVHRDIGDLRERMARLEGLFEGFTRRESAPPPPA